VTAEINFQRVLNVVVSHEIVRLKRLCTLTRRERTAAVTSCIFTTTRAVFLEIARALSKKAHLGLSHSAPRARGASRYTALLAEMPQAVPTRLPGHFLRLPPTRTADLQIAMARCKRRDLLAHELESEQLLCAPPLGASPTDYRGCA
jgi:hypothetical protein